MFLYLLQSEEEKKAFLHLVHYIALADKNISSNEQTIIDLYKRELRIKNYNFETSSSELSQICSAFRTTTSKRVCLLEIMLVMYADHTDIHLQMPIINEIANIFQIDEVVKNILRNQAMILSGSIAQCYEIFSI